MTERYDVASTEPQWDTGSDGADQILGAAGATGTRVATADSGGANTTGDRSNSGITVALRPQACVSSVVFPAPGQTGFTGGGNTATISPYIATNYSFNNTNTTEPGAKSVTTNDEAGNTPLQTTFTMTRDVTAPSFAGAPTAGGFYNTLSVPVTTTTATDAGSGLDATTYTVERDSGTVASGACTWSNTWVTVTLTAGSDNTVTAPRCFRYRMRVLDNVSNVGTSAASGTVIVDQTIPNAAGAISIAEANPSTFASGSTIFYRPAGAGGTFDVTDTNPTDANSGIGKVRFPAPHRRLHAGGDHRRQQAAPFTQTYSWTTGATDSGSKPITVFDAAGNTANTSFTLSSRLDGTHIHDHRPGREREVPRGDLSDRLVGHVHRRRGGSGVANVALSLKDPAGNYWNGSVFLGATETFNTATGTAAWTWTAPALTTNGIYTVHVVATDNVGNVEAPRRPASSTTRRRRHSARSR